MRSITFFVPSNRTTRTGQLRGFDGMNELIAAARTNRYVAAKQERENIEYVMWHAKAAMTKERFKPIKGKAHVHIEFIEPNARRDPSNVLGGVKFILDALTKPRAGKTGIGLIQDDSYKYCDLTTSQRIVKGTAGAMVTVEEMG